MSERDVSFEEFLGRSWEELEVVEHENGALMFPAELRKRDKLGKVARTPVRVRVPRPIDQLEARREARVWFDELRLDIEEDKEYLDQIEQICLLSRAIREFTEPHSQFVDSKELATYDEACLKDIGEKINHLKLLQDPRDPIQSEDDFWRIVAEIKEKRQAISPLADIAGHEQHSFIMRLVWEVSKSRTEQSSQPSSESSTAEP